MVQAPRSPASMSGAGNFASLNSLLRKRGAILDGPGSSLKVASDRFLVTRMIAENYSVFDGLRWSQFSDEESLSRPPAAELLDELIRAELVTRSLGRIEARSADACRYLTGGWLEEYAGLACQAVAADEVRIGQKINWRVGEFEGRNEVDAIARFGTHLLFVSCKALKPRFQSNDANLREKLTAALNEVDNLSDHFGGTGSRVCLFVSTDLFDEQKSSVRYPQLHGRSRALDVELISLEDLPWGRLLSRLKEVIRRSPLL